MAQNDYFRVLPVPVQQALVESAFYAYINFPPAFQFKGKFEDLTPDMKKRWVAIVESVMNTLQDKQEFVTTELMAYNERQRLLADVTEKFENWTEDEAYHNNYQRLAQLISLHADVVSAQLAINRKDFEQGNFQVSGVESTQKVKIPNTKGIE